MIDVMVMVAFSLLACVGVVQTISWFAIRHGSRRGQVFRVFPVGGAGKNTGAQMARMYACLQWEANPSKQIFVLYDMGLDERGVKDCTELAGSAGVLFVRDAAELEALLRSANG